MDLSIIILNYRSRGLLKQCLKGLQLLHFPFPAETIVVDNHSQDETPAMMAEHFPEVTFIQSPVNGGYAAGNNLGIRAASGKYLLILNPDVAVLSNSIVRMVEYLEQHPTVGLCGPRLLNPDGTVQTSCRRFPSVQAILYRRTPLGTLPFARRTLREFLMADDPHDQDRDVDWLLGACMLVRRTALEKVGLMDERFFLYFEDVDWCRRFWEQGYRVSYLGKSAEMIHYHQQLSAERPGLNGIFSYATRIHIASGLKYFSKYAGAKLPVPHYAYGHGEGR